MKSSARRVVITGMGAISPLGSSLGELWHGLTEGVSGVRPITMFDASALPIRSAAEAPQFTGEIANFGTLDGDVKKAIRKGLKTICREAQMGIAAAQLAMQDGGLAKGSFDPERAGAVFGSDYMVTLPDDFVDACKKCLDAEGVFSFDRWAENGLPAMNPLWLLKYLPNMPAAHLSMYNDLRGPNNSITEREASSNLAVGEAARIIARGHADQMIAGATGAWVHPMKTVHAVLQFELAKENGASEDRNPAALSRPFERQRTGMVLGEGAAALVLEDLESARRRGVRIYGEVVGSGASQVADRQGPRLRQALAQAMQAALRDAGLTSADVGHVHAHGESTRAGDQQEALALGDVLGDRLDKVPVVAAKSHFGNLGAGSGLVELAASVLALNQGRLFPVLNYDTPDPECRLHVARGSEPAGETVVNCNVNAQGQASCVVVRSFRE